MNLSLWERCPAVSGVARTGFDLPVAGVSAWLRTCDGRRAELGVRRWHQGAADWDLWMLRRCVGPTLDVGCGPGRLVAWLLDHGIPALGVDTSPYAGVACGAWPRAVLRGDVFDPVPEHGRWAHVLLADGNIGIGGDPHALLARCAGLLAPAGTVLVELDPSGTGVWAGHARVESATETGAPPVGSWFRWASVGMDALDELATRTGFEVMDRHQGRRCFAQLRPLTGP